MVPVPVPASASSAQSSCPARTSAPDGQSATQRPQSKHLDAKVPPPLTLVCSAFSRLIAPVGQARTQTPHAVHPVATRDADGRSKSETSSRDVPGPRSWRNAAKTRARWSAATSGIQAWSRWVKKSKRRRDTGSRCNPYTGERPKRLLFAVLATLNKSESRPTSLLATASVARIAGSCGQSEPRTDNFAVPPAAASRYEARDRSPAHPSSRTMTMSAGGLMGPTS